MYSSVEKYRIIEKLKHGTEIDEIYEETGIPKTILDEWKKEADLSIRIKKLVEEGKLERAREELESIEDDELAKNILSIKILRAENDKEAEKRALDRILELDPENVIAMSSRIKLAKDEGDIETRKKLLDMQLKVETDNMLAMSSRISIARKDGDIETEKRLLDRQLEVDPDDTIAMSGRIVVARKEGDTETEKALVDRQLELEPDSVIVISSRIKIARREGDIKTERELLDRRIALEPNNIIAIKRRLSIARTENDVETEKILEQELFKLYNNKEQTNDAELQEVSGNMSDTDIESQMQNQAQEARRLIYENKDVLQTAEQIKELLEGEDETVKIVVLAEFYFKAGLILRAQKSLKAYKKELKNKDGIKMVEQALQLTKSARTNQFNWNDLWDRQMGIQSKKISSQRVNSDLIELER